MAENIVLFVKVRTRAGAKEEFLRNLRMLIAQMSAEPNFINAFIHEDLDDPQQIAIYETWKGTRETWLREEFPREYRKPYEAAVDNLVEGREVQWLAAIPSESS